MDEGDEGWMVARGVCAERDRDESEGVGLMMVVIKVVCRLFEDGERFDRR